jgi:hypothetical protein
MSTAFADAAVATAMPAAKIRGFSSFTGSLQVCGGRLGRHGHAIHAIRRLHLRPRLLSDWTSLSNAWQAALVPPTQCTLRAEQVRRRYS